MTLEQPRTLEDIETLLPVDTSLVWATALRSRIEELEGPPPAKVSASAIADLETRLDRRLPSDLRRLLCDVGLPMIGHVQWLEPERIDWATRVWFYNALDAPQQRLLEDALLIADVGSDNTLAFDLVKERVLHCSHDPLRIVSHAPSIAELVRWDFLGWHIGKYGWADDALIDMVEEELDRRAKEWSHV